MLDTAYWKKAAEFHGHMCPGLAIGFKACEGAVAELGLDAATLPAVDEEIVCVTENDACGVDAVQSLLGCSYGKGNLVPRLRGKMAFSFYVRGDDSRAVRLVLTASAPEGAGREEWMNYLLEHPYTDLFSVGKPAYHLPEPARKFPSQNCASCGELTAEYALRIQDGAPVCTDCYDAYEREGF